MTELKGTARGMMVSSVTGEAKITVYVDEATKRNLFDFDGQKVKVTLDNGEQAQVMPPHDVLLSNIEDRLERLLAEVREMREPVAIPLKVEIPACDGCEKQAGLIEKVEKAIEV